MALLRILVALVAKLAAAVCVEAKDCAALVDAACALVTAVCAMLARVAASAAEAAALTDDARAVVLEEAASSRAVKMLAAAPFTDAVMAAVRVVMKALSICSAAMEPLAILPSSRVIPVRRACVSTMAVLCLRNCASTLSPGTGSPSAALAVKS